MGKNVFQRKILCQASAIFLLIFITRPVILCGARKGTGIVGCLSQKA
jgi:hypothetical protein